MELASFLCLMIAGLILVLLMNVSHAQNSPQDYLVPKGAARAKVVWNNTANVYAKSCAHRSGGVAVRRLLQDNYVHMHAVQESTSTGQFLGTSGTLNVWNPQLCNQFQSSISQLWMLDSTITNTIEVGWHVLPILYGDYKTHLFVYSTNNGYGPGSCYNLNCNRFVSTSDTIKPGMVIPAVSVSGGAQSTLRLKVIKNLIDGNWELYYDDTNVGYWPSNIFNGNMTNFADVVEWGGEAIGLQKDIQAGIYPAMGSGLPAAAGSGKASYLSDLMVYKNQNQAATDFDGGVIPPENPHYTQAPLVSPAGSKGFYFGGEASCT